MDYMDSPVAPAEEVRIKEETTYGFINDVMVQATRVAKGLILKEQDFNSPRMSSYVVVK